MTRPRRLATVLALDLAMVVALIVVGVRAHSLAVLAEGADYIADAAGAALCLLALWLAAREPSERHPDGFPRATSFAALANAASLLAISVAVAVGAGYRLLTGAVEVSGRPVVIVSGIAAVVMAAAVIVLRGEADDDDSGDALAMRAVLLDTIADVASAAGVAVVGVIMAVTHGWFWLDAAVALVVSLVVGSHAAALVRTVTTTLRAGGEAARAE